MSATLRPNAKVAATPTVPPDAASLAKAQARTIAVDRPSPLLYRLVVTLPILSLAVTLLVRIRAWDLILIQQLICVIAMSVGAYFATRTLVPLSTTQHTAYRGDCTSQGREKAA